MNEVQYAVVENSSGIVVDVVVWDGEQEWSPPEGCDAIQSDMACIGWFYSDGAFAAPPIAPPTPAEVLASNTSTRDMLLATAAIAIAPLQDADDLGIATEAETALLKEWKRYRVAVNRCDLTLATPAWPVAPD